MATGNNGADFLNGGAGNDTITGNAGADTITTGTGIDTIVRNGDATTDGSDTITDFTAGAGGDVIDFSTNGAQAAGAGAALTALASSTTGAIAATTGIVIHTGNNLASVDEAGVEDLFDNIKLCFKRSFRRSILCSRRWDEFVHFLP